MDTHSSGLLTLRVVVSIEGKSVFGLRAFPALMILFEVDVWGRHFELVGEVCKNALCIVGERDRSKV